MENNIVNLKHFFFVFCIHPDTYKAIFIFFFFFVNIYCDLLSLNIVQYL
jgi:hypothetical protein